MELIKVKQQEKLLDAINKYLESKGVSLSLDVIEIGKPVKLPEVVKNSYGGRNSRINVSSKIRDNDIGVVYYNRYELPRLFGKPNVPVPVDFTTAEEAVNSLNETYGTIIDVTDLKVAEMLPDNKCRIVIGENSIVYLEDSELIVEPNTFLSKLELFAERWHNYVHYVLPNALNNNSEGE